MAHDPTPHSRDTRQTFSWSLYTQCGLARKNVIVEKGPMTFCMDYYLNRHAPTLVY